MSIHIHNMSHEHGVAYGQGEQHYELCINRKVLAKFTHNFEDGLATCLRKAADAIEAQKATSNSLKWKILLNRILEKHE